MKPAVFGFSVFIVIAIISFIIILSPPSGESGSTSSGSSNTPAATATSPAKAPAPAVVTAPAPPTPPASAVVTAKPPANPNATRITVQGLCLDSGQSGNPTGKGRGLYPCNDGDWQKLWLDDKGMFLSGTGKCLDANGGSGNWYWNANCDPNNGNQTGFNIVKDPYTNNKILRYGQGNTCLDVGSDTMHWPCNIVNPNQLLSFA